MCYKTSCSGSRLAEDFRAILIFSPETLDLASGLDKNRFTLGAGYFLATGEIGAQWSRSQSALDGNHATVITLYGSRDLSRAWRVDLSGGGQSVDYDDEQILFANLGIAYRW